METTNHLLSTHQQRIWFDSQLNPDNPQYSMYFAFELRGNLDEVKFSESIKYITSKHPSLLATINQRLLSLEFNAFDISQIYDVKQISDSQELQQLVSGFGDHAFDLGNEPLAKLCLVKHKPCQYYFLIMIHHVIIDGSGFQMLLDDIATAYHATPILSAIDNNDLSPTGSMENNIDQFWHRYISREFNSFPNEFLTSYSNMNQPRKGQRLRFSLIESQKLLRCCGEINETPFKIITAAWVLLLHTLNEAQRICVGYALNTRTLNDFNNIGCFVNNLPLILDIDKYQTVRELINSISADLKQQKQFQGTSLFDLIKLKRTQTQSLDASFFNSSIIQFNSYSFSLCLDNIISHNVTPTILYMNADDIINLRFSLDDGNFNFEFEYDHQLENIYSMPQLADQFICYLELVYNNPAATLKDLLAHKDNINRKHNSVLTGVNYVVEPSVSAYQAIIQHIENTPANIAIYSIDEQLSYQDLNHKVISYSNYLSQYLNNGDCVLIALPRSIDYIISVLSLIKLGCVFVPINMAAHNRIAHIINTSKASYVICDKDNQSAFADITCLLSGQYTVRENDIEFNQQYNTHDILSIIFTSGSTGVPKGVEITQTSLMNRLKWLQSTFPLKADEVICFHSDLAFVDSLWEIFLPLYCGISMFIQYDENKTDLIKFIDNLHRFKVSRLGIVPSMLKVMLSEYPDLNSRLPYLRHLEISGESFNDSLIKQTLMRLPTVRIINRYGCTEATSIYYEQYSVNDKDLAIDPHILANTSLYILDANHRHVARGVKGEVYISGTPLARGYIGQALLTSERFIEIDITGLGYRRLYKTGDVGCIDAQGCLRLLGRLDHQIKIRGYRVELGEVESVLLTHPVVNQAVVWHCRLADDSLGLVAYVVLEQSYQAATDLRVVLDNTLHDRLPGYCCPHYYVFIEQLPLLTNGKLNRAALPAVKETDLVRAGMVPMSGILATEIAQLWQSLLGVSSVNASDDFFRLGGHSLLVAKLIGLLSSRYGIQLPFAAVFRHSRFDVFISYLSNDYLSSDMSEVSFELPVYSEGEVPLSHAQRRLYFMDKLSDAPGLYVLPLCLKLTGTLSLSALDSALQDMMQRHDILRHVIIEREGEVYQVCQAEACCPLQYHAKPDAPMDFSTWCQAILAEHTGMAMDLEAELLWRVDVYTFDEQTHLLLFQIHHLIIDGWSYEILLRELSLYYRYYSSGAPLDLPSLTWRYADYVVWEQQQLEEKRWSAGIEYWHNALISAPQLLSLPNSYPRPQKLGYQGASHWVLLPASLYERLQAFSAQEGMTLYTIWLGAISVLLHRYSASSTVVIGTPMYNRVNPALYDVLGYFANTIGLPITIDEQMDFNVLLSSIRQQLLQAQAHQSVPFDKVVETLSPYRDLSYSPIFQVMYVYQAVESIALELGESITTTWLPMANTYARYDLTFLVRQQADSCYLGIEYSTDLFSESRIVDIGEQALLLLSRLLSKPAQLVSTQCYTPTPWIAQQWSQGHISDERYSGHRVDVMSSFAHQVQCAGQAVALVAGDEQWTYQALDSLSNQWAHLLLSQGYQRGQLLVFVLPRGPWQIITVLAVLKLGGYYLGIDADYPLARIEYILSHLAPCYLLSETSLAINTPGQVLTLADLLPYLPEYPTTAITADYDADDLAYLIFTSGSTGQAKGVQITRAGINNTIQQYIKRLCLDAQTATLQFASISFDGAMAEILMTLCAGGTLYLLTQASRYDLLAAIAQYPINTLTLPPSLLTILSPEQLPGLRTLLVAGEAGTAKLLAPWRKHCQVFNAYGPSEASVCASLAAYHEHDYTHWCLGKPLGNVGIYILDSSYQLCGPGVVGEIYISGQGLAAGYDNLPAQTASHFICLPQWYGQSDIRLYRTGDLACYTQSGELSYVGRQDRQIQWHGHRIETLAIEHVLAEQVKASVVRLLDYQSTPRLVAFVVLADDTGSELSAEQDLMAYLRNQLPQYMLPSDMVMLSAIPKTVVGKYDESALIAAYDDYRQAQTSTQGNVLHAPQTRLEHILCDELAALLQLPSCDLSADFFRLGGDSILSMQYVWRLRQHHIAVDVAQIFATPTLLTLAKSLQIQAAPTQPVLALSDSGDYAVSPIQRWYFDLPHQDYQHFNQSCLFIPRQSIVYTRLQAAVAHLLASQPNLRTRFYQAQGRWRAVICPWSVQRELDWHCILERSAYSDDDAFAAYLSTQIATYQASLSLSEGLICRVILFDDSHQGQRLLLVTHHLVVDMVSWQYILTVLRQAYLGEAVDTASSSISYEQWANYLAAQADSGEQVAACDYWLTLASQQLPAQMLSSTPADIKVSGLLHHELVFDASQTSQLLQSAARAYRLRPQEVLLAGLLLSYQQQTGQSSVYVAVEGHGRYEQSQSLEVSQTVGWFTTVYPVLLHSVNESLGMVLLSVKETLRGLLGKDVFYMAHRYLRDDTVSQQLKRLPHAQIGFNYFGSHLLTSDAIWDAAPSALTAQSAASNTGIQPLLLTISLRDNCLHCRWTYAGSLLSSEWVSSMAQHYEQALLEIIAHCQDEAHVGYSPVDFPLCQLDQHALSKCLGATPGVSDVYPLSPLQQGLLYDSLKSEDGPTYVLQSVWHLSGVDITDWRLAWQRLAGRESILRTSFISDGLSSPRQVVWSEIALDWTRHDSGPLSTSALAGWLSTDKQRGFDIATGPLWRVYWLAISEDTGYFILSIHHLLLDGWCQAMLWSDVLALYQDLQGQSKALPQRRPYRDYVAWLNRQDMNAGLQYWHNTLSELSDLSLLTSAFMPSTSTSDEINVCEYRFSAKHQAQLTEYQRRHGVTMNSVLLSIWSLLLSRYTGCKQVCFGIVSSGRHIDLPGVAQILGPCINTVPLCVQVDERQTGEVLSAVIQQQVLAAQAHSYVGLSAIQAGQEWPQLFDHIVVYENYPRVDIAQLGAAVDMQITRCLHQEQTEYPLCFSILPGEEIVLRWQYRQSSFPTGVIEQLRGHYMRLCQQWLDGMGLSLKTYDLLTKTEYQQIANYQGKRVSLAHVNLATAIAAVVARQAEAIALIQDERRLSYRELWAQSGRVASYLVAHGVTMGSCVGIHAGRDINTIICLLGVIRAGGCYCPLSQDLPMARLTQMSIQANCRWIITDNSGDCCWPKEMDIFAYQDCINADAVTQHISLPTNIPADNPLYVIFTSGSTGVPKGVQITHRQLLCRLEWIQGYSPLQPDQTNLHLFALYFDGGVFNYWWTLFAGAKLVIQNKESLYNARHNYNNIIEHQVTHCFSTPSMLSDLIKLIELDWPISLTTLISGGEMIDLDMIKDIVKTNHAALYNFYGPSEATVVTTAKHYQLNKVFSHHTIGSPINNTEVYIIDNENRLLPTMVKGNIAIAGDGIIEHYIDKRVSNAFQVLADDKTKRLYCSGDIGAFDMNGEIQIYGRFDNQLSLHGLRLEPEGIRYWINQCEFIQDSYVNIHHFDNTSEVLFALIQLKPGYEFHEKELKTFMRKYLPYYAVPNLFIVIDNIKLTANGKVGKAYLNKYITTTLANNRKQTCKFTDKEYKVAQIFNDILNKPVISNEDSFIQLGGHSILMMKLIDNIEQVFKVRLNLRDLLEHDRICDIVHLIEFNTKADDLFVIN